MKIVDAVAVVTGAGGGIGAALARRLAALGARTVVVADRDATDDTWRRAFDVNVLAHVHAAQAVVPHMMSTGHGHFVVTASAAEARRFVVLPHPEVGTFWAKKAADPDRWIGRMRRPATKEAV